MKKICLLIVLTYLTFSTPLLASPQDSIYVNEMKKAILQMDKAMNIDEMKLAAQSFIQLNHKNTNDWLAPYYSAYCLVLMSFMEKMSDKKDNFLNQAQTYLDIANKLSPKNPEIKIVQAYLYQMRIEANPIERLEQYGTLLNLTLEDAKELDATNPRIYYMQAQTLFLSPEYAGGGLSKACPVAKKAVLLYAAKKSTNEILPKWGESMSNYMLRVCNSVQK